MEWCSSRGAVGRDEMRVGGSPVTETCTECTKAALLLQRNVDFCISVSSSQHCYG